MVMKALNDIAKTCHSVWKHKNGSVQAGFLLETLEPRLLLSADPIGLSVGGDAYSDDKDNSLPDLNNPKVVESLINSLATQPESGAPVSAYVSGDLPQALDLGALSSLNVAEQDTSPASKDSNVFIASAPLVMFSDVDNDTAIVNDDANSLRHEVLFVDSRTPDYQQLLDDIQQRESSVAYEIYILDPESDGIQQVSDVLAQYDQLDAVHFVSHGADGAVQLGNTWLTQESINRYAVAIADWGRTLSTEADLLFYGCNLAASPEGVSLINALSQLSGADVAASSDLTGQAALAGDWELEYTVGAIETSVAFSTGLQQSWSGVLATVNVDTFSDTLDGDTSNISNLLASKGADGFISLREAIIATNNTAGADQINLASGVYTLSVAGVGEDLAATGDLDISDHLSIVGVSTTMTVIDGAGLDRVFHIQDNAANTIDISFLTIQGGTQEGAGMLIDGTTFDPDVNLDNVRLSGNDATTGVGGGAISNAANLTISNSLIGNNQVSSGASMGGGAIANKGFLSMSNTVIESNISNAAGGGIFNFASATSLTLKHVVFSGNAAALDGGAIYNAKDLTVTNALFVNNNSIGGKGGAIFNSSILTMTNTTVSGNTANSDGGGVYNSGADTATFQNNTFTLNVATGGTGGGIFAAGTETITNNIIAGNSGTSANEISGAVETSGGSNIIGDGAGDSVGGSGYDGSDILDTDPMLGPLLNNGGLSQTHALLGGSPAIDAGKVAGAPTTDQRGNSRDLAPDIGAYEYNHTAPLWLSTANHVSAGGQAGTDTWRKADLVEVSDPNLAFEQASLTNGTFAIAFDGESFASGKNVNGTHYVAADIQLGNSSFQLLEGDLLLTGDSATWTGNSTALPIGFTNSLAVGKEDVLVFRPDTPGDYSVGSFALLLQNPAGAELRGITLIEQNTTVGDASLLAGDFLFTRTGGAEEQDVWLYQTTDVGVGTTSGTASVLLEGTDANVGIDKLNGIDLVESESTVGGQTLNAGTILLTSDAIQAGSNLLAIDKYDIYALNVTATTLVSGIGNGAATASLLFDGSDVAFDAGAEALDGLTLTVSNNQAPMVIATLATPLNYSVLDPATEIDPLMTVSDVDSTDFDSGKLTVSISTGVTVTDNLTIKPGGNVTLNVNDVEVSGVTVGTFSGGGAGTDLIINWNANSTPATVQEVLRQIAYNNVSAVPDTSTRIVDFVLEDGDGGTSAVAQQTINYAGIAAPVITLPGAAASYTENGSPVQIDPSATVADSDSPDLDTGVLTVSITTNGSINDQLVIVPNGLPSVTLSGSDVLVNNIVIGSYAGGTGGTDLVFTWNANSNAAAIQEVVRQISYSNSSDDPSGLSRTIEFTLTDGDTGTSLVATQQVNVNPVNDAPSGTDKTLSTAEETALTINSADFGFSDTLDGDTFVAVKITSLPALGSLTLNSAPVNVNDIITESDISLGLFVYTPPLDGVGSPYANFKFQVQDSGGTVNGGVNFDPTENTITINVSNIDDAPTGAVNISGTAAENQILTASNTLADGDGLGAISYQWQRDGVDITGATASTYTLVDADVGAVMTVVASYTDGQGKAESVTSAATVAVTNVNDTPTGTVAISGVAEEDQVLTASNTLADEDGLGVISYQWQRDGVDIVGATTATFTLTDTDVGAVITVVASYTDGYGAAESVTSTATAAVTSVNDAPTGLVTIAGTAEENQVLTASNTLADNDGLGAISYQWQRDGVDIAGATASTYTLVDADVGALITVEANYIDGQGTAESVSSTATAPVTNVNDAPIGLVTIAGTAEENQVLTASNTLADEDGLGAISYQWQRDGVDIAGATASTYTLVDADVGAVITVEANYIDGQGAAESVTSTATAPVTNVNDAPIGLVTIAGTAEENQVLTASNTLADEDGLGAISYQWQRDGVDIAGATTSSYALTDADVGAVITVVASYTDAQGTAESAVSAPTAAIANVNDAPTAITPTTIAINELTDTTEGLVVATLSAIDIDSGDTATYSIQGGADAAYFSLVNGNQLVLTNGVLDFETQDSYDVIVRVTDAAGAIYDEKITLSVNDVLETIPPEPKAPEPVELVSDVVEIEEVTVEEGVTEDVEEGAEESVEEEAEAAEETITQEARQQEETISEVAVETDQEILAQAIVNEPDAQDRPNLPLKASVMAVIKAIEVAQPSLEGLLEGEFNDPFSLIELRSFSQELDQLREDVTTDIQYSKIVAGSSVAASTGLSIGYVAYLLRGGVLLSSVLTSLPAWTFFDPTPVLGGVTEGGPGESADDDETLESMVSNSDSESSSLDKEKDS